MMDIVVQPSPKVAGFSEDFTSGGSTTSLGPNWNNFIEGGGTLGVSSGRAAPTGTTDGRKSSLHVTRMKTDNMVMQVTLATAPNASGLRAGPIIRANESFTNWIALLFNSTNSILVRGSGLVGWQDANVTTLATWATAASGDVITLYAADDTYYGFKGAGVSLGTPYTGRPYAIGPSTRRVGLQVSRGNFVNSGMLDNFYARDLP